MNSGNFFEIDIRTRKSFVNRNHYHDFSEIYYMAQGSCNYFIDNKIYSVMPHDIVFVQSGTIHKTVYRDGNPHKRILIGFSDDYIAPPLREKVNEIFRNRFYRPSDSYFIEDIFKKLYTEYINGSDISHELIFCYMTELFAYIARNVSSDGESNNITETNTAISEITKYIAENYPQNITLSLLADMAGYSEDYFSKLFKASTGFGYKEFIKTVRIKAAKEMLAQSRDSVCKIAFRCGFSDSNYFSSVFKKITGLPPLKYRKICRSKL